MNVLDRLDELEREATAAGLSLTTMALVYYCRNREEVALIALSRNHLRALIDVAQTASILDQHSTASARDPDMDGEFGALRITLAPLLAEEGGER